MLLEAAVDVEVVDVLMVLVEELPTTVIVESVLASEKDVPFEPDIVVEVVVAWVETTIVVVEYVTDWEMYIMKYGDLFKMNMNLLLLAQQKEPIFLM